MSKNPTKETQSGLEELYSKHQLMSVLREKFSEFMSEEFPPDVDEHGEEILNEELTEDIAEIAPDALAQIYLHKQADVPTMVGILTPKYGEPQEVADKLLAMCELDLIIYDMNVERFMVIFEVNADTQEMLDRYQYPLPMVVKPKKLRDNFDTGYMTIKGSCVLNGSEYFNDKDMCLDHLNRANSVPMVLNQEVILSKEGRYVRPTRGDNEDFIDFRKRQKQSDVFYTTTAQVMETISTLSDEVYLTHKYDRRGRCYASGYHVTTQGTDYNKSVLEFKNQEVIE